MVDINTLHVQLNEQLADQVEEIKLALGEITLIVARDKLLDVALILRDRAEFAFHGLMDVCGIDYLHYGLSEWETEAATFTGFERGVDRSLFENAQKLKKGQPRFGVVYHLLSYTHNQRIRLRVHLEEADLVVPSVVEIWPSANWFEREAFDLFGIVFFGHPDLRRILTDYGFIGHPFRKDFPLIGNVEVRYDAAQKRVVYDPVSITPRVLEPKVIRDDNRYQIGE